jgi:CRISPR-associated protein Cas1
MVKKTLYFGNPAYLHLRYEQLQIRRETESEEVSIPLEDIGYLFLDHPQITLSHALISFCAQSNIIIISCDASHLPTGILFPTEAHTLHQQRFQQQLASSDPLRKQLWQQTVVAKIKNQAAYLKQLHIETGNMQRWLGEVKSGDSSNREARAAVYYWPNVFPELPGFLRDRNGEPPNQLLNYGYAILRAIVARHLVGAGLLPAMGIHHRNQYNAFCLADDIMEPYRPYVDRLVGDWIVKNPSYLMSNELDKNCKQMLLGLSVVDVFIDGENSPLAHAVQRTCTSLSACFEGRLRQIRYPIFK